MKILDQIRSSCKTVSERAQYVRIHEDRIQPYARELLEKYTLTTELGTDHHFVSQEDAEATAAYVIALDSLNFGSGYFREARVKDDVEFGYSRFAQGLKDAFEKDILNTSDAWLNANAVDFHSLYRISAGQSASIDTLFALYAEHLRSTAQRLISDYDGCVMNFIDAATGSAETMVEILADWPAFRDTYTYFGQDVPILKRAQILPTDLHLAGVVDFHDMDRLTVFADNRVPHVLRCDDVLQYDEELAHKIDNRIPLEPGSREEVELRAVTIHTVELMKVAAHVEGQAHITSVNFDHMLWHRGAEPDIKKKPTHITRSTFY